MKKHHLRIMGPLFICLIIGLVVFNFLSTKKDHAELLDKERLQGGKGAKDSVGYRGSDLLSESKVVSSGEGEERDSAESSLIAGLNAETQALVDAVQQGRALEFSVDGSKRRLLLSRKSLFAENAKILTADGEAFMNPEDVYVLSGRIVPAKLRIAEGVSGLRGQGKEEEVMPHGGMSPLELLASFDAKHASMTVIGGNYTMSMRNESRDRVLLRKNLTTGKLEMRYEPEALHKKAFGTCQAEGCNHEHHQPDFQKDMAEAMAMVPAVDEELQKKFDTWIPVEGASIQPGGRPGTDEYQAINTTPGIDPLTNRSTKAADPIPFGEKYAESLQEFQVWCQTGPDLLPGDKANPTDAEIASMLTRILITMEEVDEIYERNLGVKMLIAEWMVRRENDGGPDKSVIMGTWRNGSEALVAHMNFYGWGGGGGAAGNSINISSWPVGTAHELGHVLSMGHTDGSDLMGPSGGPAHFWGYLTPGPYTLPVTAHQLWRQFSGRSQLRSRGLKETGKVDGEGDSGLRAAIGSTKLRHPAEAPFANDDTVVTAVNTAVTFDPIANDDRQTPGSPYYNEDLLIEEVSRMVPANAGSLEIIEQGRKLKFTPSNGFEGVVYFNYSLRGSVGNNGRGWLSRAPVAITVGNPVSNPYQITLAAGQDIWTIFPANITQVDYPTKSEMYITGDQLLLRSHPNATGSENFTVNVGGTNQQVTVTYQTPAISAVDDLQFADGNKVIRFTPLTNDVVTGQLRQENNISVTVAQNLNPVTDKNLNFRRAYVLTSATLNTPAMGTLEIEKTFHVFPDGSTGYHPNGFLQFVPADGASGFAEISYTAEDVDGRVLNGTARVIVGLADVIRPQRAYTRLRQDHGLVLESQRIAATGPDFTGTSTLQWSVVNQPTGANVTFEGATTELAVAKFDKAGRYRLRLSATDNGHTKEIDRWVIVEPAPFQKNHGEERAPWVNVNRLELVGWNQSTWNTSELVSSVSDDRFAGLIDLAPDGVATRSDGNNAAAQNIVTPSAYRAFTQYYGNQNNEFGSAGTAEWWELDLGSEKAVQWVDVHLALSQLEDSDYGRYGLVAKLLDGNRNEILSTKLLPKNEHHSAIRVPLSLAGENVIRYVRIEKPAALASLALWEVRVMGFRGNEVDLTLSGSPSQSTTPDSDFNAYKAVNKLRGGINGSRTDTTTDANWWELTLDHEVSLTRVRLHLETAMNGATVTAYNASNAQTWQVTLNGDLAHVWTGIPANTLAKRIRVALPAGLTNADGNKAVRINEFWAWGEKDLSPQTGWSQVSGPATATFTDATAVQTGVTLPATGTYVLRLTTDDLWNKTVRDFTVQYDGTSTGPSGYGLADLALSTAGGNSAIDLFAAFDDAETADASLSFEVVSVSNAAIFSNNPTGAIADPANFSLNLLAGASGSSSVTIRATDADSNSTDITFNVETSNRAPVVPDVLEVEVSELTTVNSVLVDLASHVTDPDGDSLTFTVHDNLINRRYSNTLSLAADGKLNLIGNLPALNSQYSAGTLIIEVSDGVNHIQKFTVQLTIVDGNRPPSLVSQTLIAEETTVVGHAFHAVQLDQYNDPGDSYTWQILSGNGAGDWSIDTNTGELIPLIAMNEARTSSYQLVVQATDDGVPAKSGTATLTIHVGASKGRVLEDFYTGIAGNSVVNMTGHANYPNSPNSQSVVELNGLHFSNAGQSDFGRRVRGVLTVPANGDYTFHLASDDASEFWLSTDASAANLVKAVELTGYTSELNFNGPASSAITLQAGQQYFFEILHKEGGGGDHVAVAWSGPGGISKQLIPNEHFQLAYDVDNDGLHDWWESKYMGGLAYGASDDPDQDGLTNAQELSVRSHPLVSGNALSWKEAAEQGVVAQQVSIDSVKGDSTRQVDLSALSGDATYEFFVNAEDLGQSSVNLLSGNGWAFKFEQWNNRGVFGLTRFGVSDWSFAAESGQSVASPYGALTQVAIVVDTGQSQTRLYINGVHVGTLGQVPALNAAGMTLGDTGLRDDTEPAVYAFAAYNSALSGAEIAAHHGAWFGNQAPVAADAFFSISEDVSVGTSVGNVTALDANSGNTLTYAITAGNVGNAFAIDSGNGAITTAAGLDFETTNSYTLTVTVTDNGIPVKNNTATVTVNITDANDAPVASNTSGSVAENASIGATVVTAVASDADAGDVLSYAITSGNTGNAFAINSSTGAITVAGALDYEVTPSYTLTITVTDIGLLSDTATVTVNVTNINEVPVASDGTFAVAENSAGGSAVGTVSASDPDAGDTLTYAITAGNIGGAFAIDSGTGAITVAGPLNFEVLNNYSLTVTVTDSGSLSDTATITVNVSDVNESTQGGVAVWEEAVHQGSGFTHKRTATLADNATATVDLSAISGDATYEFIVEAQDTGQPAVHLLDGNGWSLRFEQWSNTGQLGVTRYGVADYLLSAQPGQSVASPYGAVHHVVYAVDTSATTTSVYVDGVLVGTVGQVPDLTIAAVTLGDANLRPDSNPGIHAFAAYGSVLDGAEILAHSRAWFGNQSPVASNATFAVAENSAPGTAVGTVSATDPNAGDTLTYAITAGNTGGAFTINSGTGAITTAAAIDHETTASYALTVTVTDNGNPALNDTATITVNVTNVNEAPSASDTSGSVAEDVPTGTSVATVTATDPDAGDTLTYAITAGNTGGAFAIDSSGNITTAAALDYETTASYTLTVTVTDSGSLTDTATVNVTVTDVAEATGPKLVRTTVNNVSSASWTSVNLGQSYNSAVIIATPMYPNSSVAPVVTRIRNVSGSSFEVKLDRTDGQTGTVTMDVSVIAVEEGVYTVASDGVKMEAVKYTSTVTGAKNAWTAENRSYQNSYTTPVVVGQVMSANDADWSAFWCHGSSRTNPPNGSNLNVGKMVAEDPDTTRANETVGYIVIESGNGSMNGINYTAGLGGDTVRGTGNTSVGYNYSLSGLTSASAAAVSLAGLDGGDGGWAVLYGSGPLSSTTLTIAVDEDQLSNSERSHTTEQCGYIVFE